MKELVNTLNFKEKRMLAVLCGLVGVALVFFFFIGLRERIAYFNLVGNLQANEKSSDELKASKEAQAAEWSRWEASLKDMAELKRAYFYDERHGIAEIRLDLEQLFQEIGVTSSQINYEYSDLTQEGFKKINMSFYFSGSYLSLKKFLDSVERFQKFLFVEKIDFQNAGHQPGWLELKMTLAAYYGS